jgi:hypothetical protein
MNYPNFIRPTIAAMLERTPGMTSRQIADELFASGYRQTEGRKAIHTIRNVLLQMRGDGSVSKDEDGRHYRGEGPAFRGKGFRTQRGTNVSAIRDELSKCRVVRTNGNKSRTDAIFLMLRKGELRRVARGAYAATDSNSAPFPC